MAVAKGQGWRADTHAEWQHFWERETDHGGHVSLYVLLLYSTLHSTSISLLSKVSRGNAVRLSCHSRSQKGQLTFPASFATRAVM